MRFLYSNIDTFTNKREEILHRIHEGKPPDIICFTEIKPKFTSTPLQAQELSIDGYDSWPVLDTEGRGVVIYSRSSLKAALHSNTIFEESTFIEFRVSGADSFLVGVIYRSPNNPEEKNEQVNELMEWVSTLPHAFKVVTGDLNYREIDWWNGVSKVGPNQAATKFLQAVNDAFLFQHVREPTHRRPNTEPSLIDLIITNEPDTVDQISVSAPIGASHHGVITFTAGCVPVKSPGNNLTIHKYHSGDYESFKQFVRSHEWVSSHGSSAEEILSELSKVIHVGVSKFIPTVRLKAGDARPRKPPYMNEKALEAVRKKKEAWKKYTKSMEGDAYLQYKRERNRARKETRKAAREFERQVAKNAKHDPKSFFKLVNSRTKSKSSIGDLVLNGETATTDKHRAELLNKQFVSAFTSESTGWIPKVTNRTADKVENVTILTEDITKRLQAQNPNKSQGPDGLHPRVLKELAVEIGPIVTLLFQTSVDSGIVPEAWKEAIVSPIYKKKGSKKEPVNYRPVSLTSILCKIMERVISERIISHLDHFDLISTHQYGFRKKRSCAAQLLNVIETWTDYLQDDKPIDTVYFDFEKAFDKVPHQRLLTKMRSYGIDGRLLSWIASYLSNRQQKVVVNGQLSEPVRVVSGVPQGSVLGPLLFLIFINDLPEEVTAPNECRLFADDTKLFGPVESAKDCQRIQSDIDAFTEWATKWQMSFHPAKCKVLRIGGNHPDFEYTMQGTNGRVQLEIVDKEKDLGIITDSQLKFKEHISTIVSKAKQRVGMIRRGFRFIDTNVLSLLFKSMVRPILETANTVWAPSTLGECRALEGVQRNATRLVSSLRGLTYQDRLRTLKLPSLSHRRKRGDMIEVFKRVHGFYDDEFPWIKLDENEKGLRSNGQKLVKERKTNPQKRKTFSVRAQNDWKSLPTAVANAPTLNTFKSRLDRHWAHLQYEVL